MKCTRRDADALTTSCTENFDQKFDRTNEKKEIESRDQMLFLVRKILILDDGVCLCVWIWMRVRVYMPRLNETIVNMCVLCQFQFCTRLLIYTLTLAISCLINITFLSLRNVQRTRSGSVIFKKNVKTTCAPYAHTLTENCRNHLQQQCIARLFNSRISTTLMFTCVLFSVCVNDQFGCQISSNYNLNICSANSFRF